ALCTVICCVFLCCVDFWCLFCCCGFLFFFFQAEDGIRDDLVTGVQTCALPIFTSVGLQEIFIRRDQVAAVPDLHVFQQQQQAGRSEERRVGKECRSRRSADH